MPKTSREYAIKYGIVVGIFILMLTILISFIYISQPSWETGLKKNIVQVLNASSDNKIILGKRIKLNSLFETSLSCYKIFGTDEYAIIMRLQNITGPSPAVFKYVKGDKKAEFCGYAIDNAKASVLIEKEYFSSSINYWEEKIPQILLLEEND